jgi:hypothetical protein
MQAAQSLDPQRAHDLVHRAQQTFAHAFGVAMLLGCGVILLNSLFVWTFQHRGTVHAAPEGPAEPAATDEAEVEAMDAALTARD